jgi:signal transduction histidine kinase
MTDPDQASTPESSSSRPDPARLARLRHDMNGELFLIRGYADMLKHDATAPTPEKRRELAGQIEGCADRLATLIRQLRSLPDHDRDE